MNKLRVVLGLLDICHYYSTLARGLEEIGVDANFICLDEATRDFYSEKSHSPYVRSYIRAYARFHETRNHARLSLSRYVATLNLLWTRLALVVWIALTADAIVLKSGESLLESGVDLRLYKAFGVRVLFIFHGSDSRPPYLNAFYASRPVALLRDWTLRIHAAVARISGIADYIVDNPCGAYFHKDRVCCFYQVLGNPIDNQRIAVSPAGRQAAGVGERKFRILHAPSLAELKGTALIRECIARLRNEGFEIEYVELSGVPNSVVIAEIKSADLVIDELFSDIHGATLAMESIACGCPVVVGGYCFDQLEKVVPKEFIPPTVTCRPNDLYSTVRSLIEDPERRTRIRQQAREFYLRVGSAGEAARRLVRLIEGKAPREWFFDVDANRVAGIVAGPPSAIVKNIRSLQENFGVDALMLDDKPELNRDLLRLVQGLEA